LSDHTTADDASRYRDDAEVSKHWPAEPILRLRTYLHNLGEWGKDQEEKLLHDCNQQIEQAIAAYLATVPQQPSAIFEATYARLPADLVDQSATLHAQTRTT
jgi:pyruvate dehydrogenase E1 component alpha subunit